MRLLVLLALTPLLVGCASQRTDRHTIAPTASGGEIEGRPTLGMPIPIPGQDTVLVPFAIENVKSIFQSNDPYAHGRVAQQSFDRMSSLSAAFHGSQSEVRWHNAIFRVVSSGKQWPLLTQRGIISHWQVLGVQPKPDGPFQTHALLFLAVLDDTNKDGLLDDLDARVAILTEANGSHPHIITPPDAQVWSAFYDPEKDLLFLQVVRDTNSDGKFNFGDMPTPYMINAKSAGSAAPVITDEGRAALERVLGASQATPR